MIFSTVSLPSCCAEAGKKTIANNKQDVSRNIVIF
jgi:hypothetical protein